MAVARWQATIVDESGDVQPSASITVRREAVGAPLATIYSDRDGLVPLGNPFTADSSGFAAFHAAGGAYRIDATLGGFTRTWRYVGIGLGSEADSFIEGAGTVAVGELPIFDDTSGNSLDGSGTLLADILDCSDLSVASESAQGVVEMATNAEIRSAASGAKAIMAEDIETASAAVALSDAATVAVDWDSGINFTLTVTANRAIGNPTNGQPGTYRTIMVQGNNSTDRTITFGNQYLGEVPTITDCDSGRWYLLTIYCHTTTHFVVSAKLANGS